MSRVARRMLVVLVALGGVAVIGLALLAPDQDGICDRMLGLARAGGEDLAAAGVDDASCRAAVQRRRAKMGPLRRVRYGICVVMADTLDEIGRC